MMEGGWSLSFSGIFNSLVFLAIAFVIFKHFISAEKERPDHDLDDLVREKKRIFEQTIVTKAPELAPQKERADTDFFEQWERKLQWGGEEFDSLIKEILKEFGYPKSLTLKISAVKMKGVLNGASSKKNFVNSLVAEGLADLFNNTRSLKLEPLASYEFKFNAMILIGEEESLFKNFKGTPESVNSLTPKNIKSKNLESFVSPEFFEKAITLYEETRSFFILPEQKVREFFEKSKDPKKVFRELSLHYHPDRIPWRYVPESERKRLSEVYTSFYTAIQGHYNDQN